MDNPLGLPETPSAPIPNPIPLALELSADSGAGLAPASLDAGALAAAIQPAAALAPAPPAMAAALAADGQAPPSWFGFFIPLAVFVVVLLLSLSAAPLLLTHWRIAEAQAEGEAAYIKRRAELRAEADAAEARLNMLDKRTHLVSLGFREVVRLVLPKVVNVHALREVSPLDDPLAAKHGFIHDPEKQKTYISDGVGSGLLVEPGVILTNHHVVRSAPRLRITFASGQSLSVDAQAVAADSLADLAIIKLPKEVAPGLRDDINQRADFADSDKDVERGDLVLALGSPLGLKHTVTHGVISAKGRLLSNHDLVELLQTDAPINRGNSGGPLFDHYGKVVGINVAIASDNGGNQGIGFAIPSNTAKSIYKALLEHGEVVRGFIGVGLDEVPLEKLKLLKLEREGAVHVTRVLPGLSAHQAGLKVGDVIVRYNEAPLAAGNPVRHLRQAVLETPVGERVPLEVLRAGERLVLTLQIGRRPANTP